jgi:hypothetical protein
LRESRADHQALELVSNCLKLRICGVLLGFLNGARCRDRICDPFRVKEHTRVAFQGFSAYGAVMGHFPGRVAACLSVGWYHVIEHATVDAAQVVIATTTAGWISKRKERPRTIPLAAGPFSVPVVLGWFMRERKE